MSNAKTEHAHRKIKTLSRLLCIAATAVGMAACGESKEDQAHNEAAELASQIDAAIENSHYVEAIALIDSLNRAYPDEVELRKSTLLSRARAMEGMILDSIPVYDAELARIQAEMSELEPQFVNVAMSGLDGYKVEHGAVDAAFTSHTAVQPRLGDDDTPWTLAVNLAGRSIGIRGLQLKTAGTVTAQIMADNAAERRVRSDVGEMFSFGPEEADVIASSLTPGDSKVVITVVGERGNVDIAVNEKMSNAIRRTARMAQLRTEDHNARVTRELLERKLLVARDQIANFTE